MWNGWKRDEQEMKEWVAEEEDDDDEEIGDTQVKCWSPTL